ncbi:MAG: lipid A biosynthesis protein [Alphaproteobacteria bacterium]|nr:lipid A biosynthesis protein [Alphaproteobacteria bacterium]NDC55512.1 lipid A biosynthesis protein [Alphaproteobacteria bacterium]
MAPSMFENLTLWIQQHLNWMVALGLLGQGLFTMRFVAQWFVSEKAGKSIVPEIFWYFSFGGGVILLTYAIWRQDPVFILGQAAGLLIYARNLYFIWRDKWRARPA